MKLRTIISILLAILTLTASFPVIADNTMPYAITVDLTSQIVTIYRTDDGSIVRQMLCSTAKPGCKTPEGVFEMTPKRRTTEREKWYYIAYYQDYVQWSSRITGNILFHSLPYTAKDEATLQIEEAKQFGFPASHGCIRLLNDDSKFIAQNCLPGTMVKIYSSGDPQTDLRDLLFEGSYTQESGLTYDQFLGTSDSPDVLGRFSTGSDVEDLQYRLRALGFYNDEITGVYGTSTVTAVKHLQKQMGAEQNGQVSPVFSALIFSPDAPTGTNVVITEGMSGPIVRELQENLAALRLYDGEMDGIYDVDVIESTEIFLQAYGYEAEGGVTPEAQQAISYEAARLGEIFSDGRYSCEIISESINFATISANDRVRIRSGPTTDSDPLDRVSSGEQVLILETGERWSRIQHEDTKGYINNKYLVPTPAESYTVTYSAPGGSATHSFGGSSDSNPASALVQHMITAEPASETYAVITTGSDATKLNLRSTPSSDGEILVELENSTEVRVLNKGEDWSFVSTDHGQGFLMNKYLEFRVVIPEAEAEDEGSDAEEEIVEQSVAATVNAPTGYAVIYDIDSEDANQVGILPHSTDITLLTLDDGWCLIDYNGHRGYMYEENVRYDPDDLEL